MQLSYYCGESILNCSTMKCYSIRTAEGCTDGNDLHCSMRSRRRHINEEKLVIAAPYNRSVTFYSPGHNQTRPHYFNRNFCIYNISLNCPGQTVTLNSKPNSTVPLSDGDTCEDYLWFDMNLNVDMYRGQKVCGNQTVNLNTTMKVNSFLAVLWTNGRNSAGSFGIEARCKNSTFVPTEGSGDDKGLRCLSSRL